MIIKDMGVRYSPKVFLSTVNICLKTFIFFDTKTPKNKTTESKYISIVDIKNGVEEKRRHIKICGTFLKTSLFILFIFFSSNEEIKIEKTVKKINTKITKKLISLKFSQVELQSKKFFNIFKFYHVF